MYENKQGCLLRLSSERHYKGILFKMPYKTVTTSKNGDTTP